MSCTFDMATKETQARIPDALTELHMYVHILAAELQRVEDRIVTLSGRDEQTGELDELRCRRGVLAAQLDLLDRMIVGLRALADPSGQLF